MKYTITPEGMQVHDAADIETLKALDAASAYVDGSAGWIKLALTALDQAGLRIQDTARIAAMINRCHIEGEE